MHVDIREHFQSAQVVVRTWEKGVGEGGCGAVRAAHASVPGHQFNHLNHARRPLRVCTSDCSEGVVIEAGELLCRYLAKSRGVGRGWVTALIPREGLARIQHSA